MATTGRPGPVLIDVPKDIANSHDGVVLARARRRPRPARLPPGDRWATRSASAPAAELLLAAERPVIYAGGGILKARAAEALRELAERTGIPVVTTLMARGAFPDSHPLCLGMPGMHGNYTAVTAMQQSDLLIALGQPLRRPGHRQGRRLRPRRQGHPRRHRPGRARQGAPARRGHRRRLPPGHRGAAGGPGRGRPRAGGDPPAPVRRPQPADLGAVAGARSAAWQERFPLHYDQQPRAGALKPQFVLETLRDSTPDDTIVASGVGQHQMWASPVLAVRPPLHLGQLGRRSAPWASPCPAAIGAKVGRPTGRCGPSTATAASR